jgi:RsiW-degrading membrane proteinase PrsW (M82 family)
MASPATPATAPAAALRAAPSGVRWYRVLLWGVVLWAASIAAFYITENAILVPTVLIIGSFVVPATAIYWLLEHRHHTTLPLERLLRGFFVAGVLGLVAAALLEQWLLPGRVLPNLWIGLIEEATKGLGVWLIARRLPAYPVRDGLLLGATVGFGFGAFESSGYAFSYALTRHGISLEDLVQEEVLRAVLAPFAHGVWTGLLGGALFRATADRRLRSAAWVLATYLAVSLLHAIWDGAPSMGVVVTILLGGGTVHHGELATPWLLDDQLLYGLIQSAVIGVVAVAGALLFRRAWRACA